MKYTQSQLYRNELRDISDVLELINYRPRTIDSYLQSIFECCSWLDSAYGISINNAQVEHLRSFLLYLKRSKEDGGLGYAPRSVNIYNCALKKYFRFVLRRPLSDNDLPLCRVDHPLPKVPSKKDVMHLILGTGNLKHQAELAVAYGTALRLTEVTTLRFRDISFTDGTVTISEEVSKSRYAGKVELPVRLRNILRQYWEQYCRLQHMFKNRLHELGWEKRGYSFHSLRHAHALHYYQSGADLFQVQQRLRHRSISSTLIYVQLDARLKERKHIENPFDDPDFPQYL